MRNGDASGAGLSYYAGPSTGAIVGAGAISGSLTSEKDLIKQGLIDAPVQMAPFNVTADADRGYAASNTLAGSRLNLPIQDLASSITVVTKEQLADFSKSESFDALAGKKEVSPKTFETDDAKRPASPAGQTKPSVEETSTARDSVSTFSLHVSDVSFRLAQAALARGEMPDASRIRPEEFYNAFDYGDAAPTPAEKIGCRIEQSAHPFLQQRNLVRIAMKVPATGRGAGTPLRLTILLDTSGSMEREDRAAAVRAALNSLVSLVGANDRVTLIGFARTPRLIAEDLPGDRARELLDLVARTPAEGGTNLEAALALAGELVDRHFLAAAQNRIVLITDGAANLGAIDPKVLAAGIETLRARHIALDVCGVGLNGLDDDMLESLTRKSDGRYYVLNSPADADAGFAQQLAGAFRPAAENVKVQVRFNPARVASYRLIGFEQHRLREEDFRNDKVDAAELAADEAAVALYQVEPLPQGEGELGEVFVRFRDAASGAMVERSWTMTYEPQARAFDRATPSMQLAGTAGLLAEKLRGDTAQTQFKLADLAPVVNALRNSYANQPRVQELATMFAQLRRLSGE
ncbi:MAG TPA: von Willebrand factor type A domain-containing protein [Opitutaceae bacterium]|nr:von Willebrand factor type A domain-containing protein [Opitutaceae bacterium]